MNVKPSSHNSTPKENGHQIKKMKASSYWVLAFLLGVAGLFWSLWYVEQHVESSIAPLRAGAPVTLDAQQSTMCILLPFRPGIKNLDIPQPALKHMIHESLKLGPSGQPQHLHKFPQILLNTRGEDYDTVYYILYFAVLFSSHSGRKILMSFLTPEDEAIRAWHDLVKEEIIENDSAEGLFYQGQFKQVGKDQSASKHIAQLLMHFLRRQLLTFGEEHTLYLTSKAREEEIRTAYAPDMSFEARTATGLIHAVILKGMKPLITIFTPPNNTPTYTTLLSFCQKFNLI